MNTASQTDRIERSTLISAPRDRVWRALTNAEEFGTWFGAHLQGQFFVVGERTRGRIAISGYEHLWFDVVVVSMDAPRHFSFQWHPYPNDPAVDYSQEEPTLVTFSLEEAADHQTLLRVVESGFDRLPPHRRLEAFRMNDHGWEVQLGEISGHVTSSAGAA